MYYKEYGNTGLKVSAVGMGTMRYNDDDVQAGKLEKCAEIPLYAFEKGINYFDSAPYYCFDKSEEITGLALAQLPRDKFFVTSKLNFNTLDQKPTRDNFRRRLELSLKRLRVDYLDFYHLWCMLTIESFEEQRDALYGFFEEARSEGLIRNIVTSVHLQGKDIEKVVATNQFRGILLGYNALNYRFRQSGIEAAYQSGMGVVVMNPLGGGLIPRNPDTFRYLNEGTDLTVPQAAIRFVASHKEITIALAGCTTKAHVDDAIKAVENLREFSAQEIVSKYEGRGIGFNNLCTSCGYCNYCPKGIEIPKYMDSYNEKVLSGSDKAIIDRLEGHWGISVAGAGECVGCKKCETLCTQHLPIVERLREISRQAK